MSRYQRQQPLLSKEAIGPALMVAASPPAFAFLPFAQQAPKSPTRPSIDFTERGLVAFFEMAQELARRMMQEGGEPRGSGASLGTGAGMDGASRTDAASRIVQ